MWFPLKNRMKNGRINVIITKKGGTVRLEQKRKIKVSFNSPVILGFSLICLMVFLLGLVTGHLTDTMFFSVYRSSISNPFTYVRLIGHVFGHANWEHFIGNISLLLVLGPLLEEKYGSLNMVMVMVVTAVVTGLAFILLFPGAALCGASGVVFALILMSSFASFREGTIPLTFILVAVIYVGGQIINGIFKVDNVSNFTHIIGGIVGAVMGYALYRFKTRKK